MHPVENPFLVVPTEIQVLQPYEVTLVPGPLDDLNHIRDAGEDR